MENKIKTLKTSVGGYMGYSFEVKIDFENSLSKYTVFKEHYEKLSSEIINLSREKIEVFINTLDVIKITEWKHNYENPGIMDGTSWSVTICFDNNKEARFTGDNSFPEHWETFCKSMQNLIGESFG